MADDKRRHTSAILGQHVSAVKAQAAKDLRRNMTPAECVLWARLRANQLQGLHFRRQQVIRGLIVDFYCHAHRLIVEVDGGVHSIPDQAAYDKARTQTLEANGFTIIRFTNKEIITNIENVLAHIAQACERT